MHLRAIAAEGVQPQPQESYVQQQILTQRPSMPSLCSTWSNGGQRGTRTRGAWKLSAGRSPLRNRPSDIVQMFTVRDFVCYQFSRCSAACKITRPDCLCNVCHAAVVFHTTPDGMHSQSTGVRSMCHDQAAPLQQSSLCHGIPAHHIYKAHLHQGLR